MMDFEFDYQHRVENRSPMEEDRGEEALESPEEVKIAAVSDEIIQRDHGGGSWTCGICLKEFSSGKALNGHMRIHVQQAASPAGAGGFRRESHRQDPEREGKPTCALCNKTFYSLKSLLRHMRYHPERAIASESFAGLDATPSSTIDSDPADELEIEYCSSSVVDLLMYLDNWPVKARRTGSGSGSGSTMSTAIDATLDDDEIGAVEALMMLSSDKIGSADEDSDNSKIHLNSNTDHSPKRKKIEPKSYSCTVCSKQFTTPQALGGHKSSAHNKALIKLNLTENGGSALKPHNHTHEEQSTHICKICGKPFPTGQALGGHMRRHYQGPSPAVEKPHLVGMSSDRSGPSGSLSAVVTADDSAKEAVLGFDLNELPDGDGAEQWWN